MIKKYIDDPSLSWEERYLRLDFHHVQETAVLRDRIRAAIEYLEGDAYVGDTDADRKDKTLRCLRGE